MKGPGTREGKRGVKRGVPWSLASVLPLLQFLGLGLRRGQEENGDGIRVAVELMKCKRCKGGKEKASFLICGFCALAFLFVASSPQPIKYQGQH